MKTNQTDQLNRGKTDDKKGNKSNKVEFTKDGKPAKDV